jgi:hypothetical protein
MRKLTLTLSLLMVALFMFEMVSFGSTVNSVVEASPHASTIYGEPTLQEWFDEHGYAINVTGDETGIEIFEAGYYRVSVLAEIAAYAPINNLSWYLLSDGQLNLLFLGENTVNDTVYFLADDAFGLCLGSPEGYFYTEAWRNEDGKDHALVSVNPNASGYIIAWEDLWDLGDADFQDFVLALTPVNVCVRFCPRTLNLKSRGKWITAIVRLPKEYNASDVDISSILINGTVPADQRHYIICKRWNLIVLKFNRTAIIELIKEALNGTVCKEKSVKVLLTLTGKFSDGTPFQGKDKIRVVHFKCCKHA